MWTDSPDNVTAEWQCTQCDTTNRKLLPVGSRQGADKCMHCGKKHIVTPSDTPVRWNARAA